jgi:hypothetical protein
MTSVNEVCRLLVRLHGLGGSADREFVAANLPRVDRATFVRIVGEQSAWVTVTKKLTQWGLSDFVDPQWKKDFVLFEEKSRKRQEWIARVLSGCAKKGISLIPLKGGLIGPVVHRDPSYKKMNDFDFLVPRARGAEVLSLLREIGFLSFAERIGQKEDVGKSHHAFPYYSPDRSCVLGPHWSLVPPESMTRIREARLWSQPLTAVEIDGLSCFRLPWEWHLLHLCVHLPFYKTGVRELADVANLIRFAHPSLTWDRFRELARETRAERSCFRVLRLTAAIFEEEALIPRELLEEFRSKCPSWEIHDAEARAALGPSLILKRSTLPAKIEKAFALSVLSREYRVRVKAWAASWVLSFWPPKSEVEKIDLAGSRPRAVARVLRLLMRDHGVLQFWGLTAWNLGQVAKWSVREILRINPMSSPQDRETLELLKSLE